MPETPPIADIGEELEPDIVYLPRQFTDHMQAVWQGAFHVQLQKRHKKRFSADELPSAEATAWKAVIAEFARTPSAREAKLIEALKRISGGFIPGAATDALLNGDWHPSFSALQTIARQAIADLEGEK